MAINLDPSQKFGTLEEQVLTLAHAFRQRGGQLLPVYRRDLDAEGAEKYRARDLRAVPIDLNVFTPARLLQLIRLIRREAVEVVQWNLYAPLTNPYLWAVTLLAPTVKHVYADHISRPSPPNDLAPGHSARKHLIKRLLGRRYAAVACVSEFVREQIRTDGTWPDAWLGTHFVNTARFAPDPDTRRRVRDELGNVHRFVALAVAHLIPEKGVAIAVRALASLPGSAALWVIGDGPESESLRALAGELGVEDRVRWLGLQRHVEPFMQAADCLVCPSLWAEAAGLVNIEALASGLPVIASAVGGIPEIVEEGRTGFLVPPGDPEALAGRLLALMNAPSASRGMSSTARAEALDRYSAEVVLPEHLEFYRELLKPRRRHSALVHAGPVRPITTA
jgi:glycosyltransferase involved in cell wall biosynthesis